MPVTSPRPARLAWGLALVLLVSLAVALLTRLLALDFGVPDMWHPDEQRLIYNPAKHFAAGEGLELPWWPHPPLMAELVGTVLWLFPFDPPTLRAIAVGRGISAGIGVVGVLATGMAGWTLTRRVVPSLVAALLVALSPIAVQLGHYATPDGAALGCVGLCLWACARLLVGTDPDTDPDTETPGGQEQKQGPWPNYLAAGVATGLAGAFKYNAALVAVLVIAASLARMARGRTGPKRAGLELLGLGLAGLAAVGVFMLSVAPLWSELDRLTAGLGHEWSHYAKGHTGFGTERPAADALRTLASCGVGPVALCACIGVVAVRESSERAMLAGVALLCAAYLVLLSPQRVFFDRVVFVLIPPLALAAALCADGLASQACARLGAAWPARRAWLSALLACALLGVPAQRSAALLTSLATSDTRARARDFLREHSPMDARIVHLPRDVYLAPTISGRENVRPNPSAAPRLALRRHPDYVVFVEGYWERFESDPEGGGDALAQRDAWERALARRYVLLRSFVGPPLPCRGCPGTTISAYHQPRVSIYQRRAL